jgi:DNA-binding XRE family transcriptional regulator
MGRPGKASTKVANAIAAYVKRGYTLAQAAEAAGVDRSSLFNWLKGDTAEEIELAGIVRAAQRSHAERKRK